MPPEVLTGVALPSDVAARLVGVPLALEARALRILLGAEPKALLDSPRDAGMAPYAVVDGVAIVPVIGVLMKRGTGLEWVDRMFGIVSTETLGAALEQALVDPLVNAILLQVDSPGGDIHGIFDLADQILAARTRKPIWSIADEEAYSAGYLIASAAERVYMPRAGGVGSIGIIAVRIDRTIADQASGVTYTIVTSGARKADGNEHVPVTEPEALRLVARVESMADLFVNAVARHRGLDPTSVRGQEAATFHGNDAVQAGLIDGVRTFGQTLQSMRGASRSRSRGRDTRMQTDGTTTGAAADGAQVIQMADHRRQVDEARASGKTEGAAEAAAATKAAETARLDGLLQLCALVKAPEALALEFFKQGIDAEAARPLLAKRQADEADAARIQSQHDAAAGGTARKPLTADEIFARRKAAVLGAAATVGVGR